MNLFILIASSITGDNEKGDNLFFRRSPLFGQHNTISDVIDHYFMAAFTQFWLKTCINMKYFKKPTVHLQIFHDTQFGKHCPRRRRKHERVFSRIRGVLIRFTSMLAKPEMGKEVGNERPAH